MSIEQESTRPGSEDATASIEAVRGWAWGSVAACCWGASHRVDPISWGSGTSLVRDLCLGGAGILRVGELLEEEHDIIITSAELMDIALAGATVGLLVDLVTAKIMAAAR